MLLTIATETGDIAHIDIPGLAETTPRALMQRIHLQLQIPPATQHLSFGGKEWAGEDMEKPLQELGVGEHDVVLLQRAMALPPPTRPPASVVPPSEPAAMVYAETLRQRLVADPAMLTRLSQHQPELAAAALGNPAEFTRLVVEIERQKASSLAAAGASAAQHSASGHEFDVDIQRRIEEAIRQENVLRNMETALEFNPESFGRVHMLYINVEVNGHPIKAFVDSGAQATIMSPQCAEACGLMRLLDRRFAGIARGVGTAKILGRVHSATLKVGGLHLACSFTVMDQGERASAVDLLFGLDMLKRYQASIDLKQDALVIQDEIIPFLPEHLLPLHARIEAELTPEEKKQLENERKAGGGSASQAPLMRNTHSQGSVLAHVPPSVSSGSGHSVSSAPPRLPARPPAPLLATPQFREDAIQAIMGLGVNREEAIKALTRANGNVDVAASLLFDV